MDVTITPGLVSEFTKANTKVRAENEERLSKEKARLVLQRDKIQFKAIHGLLIVFFLWIVAVHGIGIYLFTRGFLLTRLVLPDKSECSRLPYHLDVGGTDAIQMMPAKGCWHTQTFDRAVIVVIDALRYDFTVPYDAANGTVGEYHNALTILSEIATKEPSNALLFPFIADPPTTTLARLKGLTTGSLPTFLDAGANFAGEAIEEDNLISQLYENGRKLAFLGDDTWMALFGRYFESNISHPYDSLNVWDLHTVDNGINEHIFKLLEEQSLSKWDVLIAHYLGVDHAGHRYGPDHTAMNKKLRQMNGVIERLIETIDDETLLVILGDHGMDSKGDHGGESQQEIESALWMYSRKGIFGHPADSLTGPEPSRAISQIDIVPTLSLLLGVPIPFNNLGAPIAEAFLGPSGDDWRNLAEAARLTDAQIIKYQMSYAIAKGDQADGQDNGWETAEAQYQISSKEQISSNSAIWTAVYEKYSQFQEVNLRSCKALWATFDLISMYAGLSLLLSALFVLYAFARGIAGKHVEVTGLMLQRITTGISAGAIAALLMGVIFAKSTFRRDILLYGIALGGILGFASGLHSLRKSIRLLPNSTWGIIAGVFGLMNIIYASSNSFVIWEDRILVFLLATFGIGGLINSQQQSRIELKALGTYHSVVFLLLNWLASNIRLCREEQIPFCQSTFYASASSSVSSPLSLVLLLVAAVTLPFIIKSFFQGTRSYEGPAKFFVGFALRLGLLLSTTYWMVDSADNGNWISINESLIKAVKMLIAQLVIGMGLVAGNVGFVLSQICLGIERIKKQKNSGQDLPGTKISSESGESVVLLGYSNLHGSRYLLLVLSWALPLILIQKPYGGLSTIILLWQILNVLEILDCNNLTTNAIGPVIFGLLGSSHFFSTGHQATLQAIQWESAFIPLKSVVYPWSPMLIILNSMGPQMLTAVAVPLLALWKRDPKSPGLLSNVVKAAVTYILFHSVVGTSGALWAGWHRRHLMLHKIFSPRFMLDVVVLLVVDVVIAIVSIGGIRSNILAVAEVFGFVY